MLVKQDICCNELFLSILKKRHVLQDDIDRENEKWVIITEYLPPSTYYHCLPSISTLLGDMATIAVEAATMAAAAMTENNDTIPITPLKLPICPFCYKVWNKTAIREKKLWRRIKRSTNNGNS
jgi:hypothetical protein